MSFGNISNKIRLLEVLENREINHKIANANPLLNLSISIFLIHVNDHRHRFSIRMLFASNMATMHLPEINKSEKETHKEAQPR